MLGSNSYHDTGTLPKSPCEEGSITMSEKPEGDPSGKNRIYQASSAVSPSQIEGLPAHSEHQPNAPEGAQRDHQPHKPNLFNRLGPFPIKEWLTFLIALGSLAISYFTYRNAADTSNLMNAITTLVDMSKQVKRQADLTQEQLALIHAEQRPWMGLMGIQPLPNSTAFYVNIVNSGKTPAIGTNVLISGVPGEKVFVSDQPCDAECDIRNLVMLPGVPISLRVPKIGEPDPPRDIPFWIRVRIDYADTGGQSHKTGICLRILPDSGRSIVACPSPVSNYAD